ncbi:MAG: F0F1 ATP synthase subunit gamma [Acidiferrobacterales bacterium]|nr:F0F1 ATP synthase subunit gamma [Acidiferrobacterales bacterium]
MAGAKEIRTKIRSIENTQKITSAMEMVAASKMRRAQERMRAARPYAESIRKVVNNLWHASLEYAHPYAVEREVKSVGYIVVSSDRGLCGGLNINLFRNALESISQWQSQDVPVKFGVFGSKGLGFFRRLGADIICQASHLGDAPQIVDLIGSVKVMLDAYEEGELDRLYLVSNQFVNTMTQGPTVDQILPIKVEVPDDQLTHHWDYLYEPESHEVVDTLMTRYIESIVYRAVVENIACEQSARMVAMKAASDNAGNLIDELNLIYNKARQAAITQEISEIVGGAAAV